MVLVTSAILIFPLLAGSATPEPITISLAHDKPAERQTKAQLERLLATYDLSHWTFTRTLAIDEDAIPHSHPVLTLHTRHLKDDDLMVSTYVHEQMHWFLSQHKEKADAAFADLMAKYPKIPVGFPEGSNDEHGNYAHLAVVYLEYRADRQLLGELRAREVMEFWSHDHYTWIYRTVLEQARDIGQILLKHGLML
ncbi:MAG TPA: hypothetical protein VKE50_06120 [Thermoanaerobaculia bacterium]|nr:hypothetical protein [Thermoanaerobaculia bacterium]